MIYLNQYVAQLENRPVTDKSACYINGNLPGSTLEMADRSPNCICYVLTVYGTVI